MEVIKEYVEEMLKKSNNTADKLIIDDILDIAKGVYHSYNDYVECKRMIIEMVRTHNNYFIMDKNNTYHINYWVEPVIISKDVFCYIVSKR